MHDRKIGWQRIRQVLHQPSAKKGMAYPRGEERTAELGVKLPRLWTQFEHVAENGDPSARAGGFNLTTDRKSGCVRLRIGVIAFVLKADLEAARQILSTQCTDSLDP